MTRQIVIVTDGCPPWPGQVADAAGRRAWALGQSLAQAGHSVCYALPEDSPARQAAPPAVALTPAQSSAWAAHDGVVCVGWPTLAARGRTLAPVILDLAWPCLAAPARTAEGLSVRDQRAVQMQRAQAKVAALRAADAYLCAGARQRVYYANWLALAGIPAEAERLVDLPLAQAEEVLALGILAPTVAPCDPTALLALVARVRARPAATVIPVPVPAAPLAPAAEPAAERLKGWPELVREIRYHYSHGGVQAVWIHGVGFVGKLVRRVTRRQG